LLLKFFIHLFFHISNREKNLRLALAYKAQGKQELATRHFERAVAVKQEMVAAVKQQLDKHMPSFVMLSDADGFAPFLFDKKKIDLFISNV
jgi:hypothetical protein